MPHGTETFMAVALESAQALHRLASELRDQAEAACKRAAAVDAAIAAAGNAELEAAARIAELEAAIEAYVLADEGYSAEQRQLAREELIGVLRQTRLTEEC